MNINRIYTILRVTVATSINADYSLTLIEIRSFRERASRYSILMRSYVHIFICVIGVASRVITAAGTRA